MVGNSFLAACMTVCTLMSNLEKKKKIKGQRRSPCNCRGVPGFTSFYGFVRNRVHSAYPGSAPSVSSTSRAETRTMPLVPGLYSCETRLKIYAALGGRGGGRRDLTEGNTAVQVRARSQCTRQSRELNLPKKKKKYTCKHCWRLIISAQKDQAWRHNSCA